MAGSNNGDFFYGNPLPPEFAHWPLDLYMDDDEFRAGYPFTDIPEIESNDDCESHNTSSTFDNDVVQSDSSDDDICMSTEKENNQLNETAEQKEKTMDEAHENHDIHLNQLNSYIKEELDDNHLHHLQSQVNTTNGETLELSQHVDEND